MINSLIHGLNVGSIANALASSDVGPGAGVGQAVSPSVGAVEHAGEIRYVNADTGDDALAGTSSDTAWKTLAKGLTWLQRIRGTDQAAALRIAGDFTTETADRQLDLGSFDLGGMDQTFDAGAVGPANLFSRSMRRIEAEPVLVQSLTVLSKAADPVTGLITIAVDEVLVASAHVGQRFFSAELGFWATVIDNTTDHVTLAVASLFDPTTATTPGLYVEGATIAVGDSADAFGMPLTLLTLADWAFFHLKIVGSAAQGYAARIEGNRIAYFLGCDLNGVDLEPSTYTYFDACYLHDGTFGVNGGSFLIRNSLCKSLKPRFHGVGIFTDINESAWQDADQPFGTGVTQTVSQFSAANCSFTGSASHGVECKGGGISRLTNCDVSDNVGDGVVASQGADMQLTGCGGAGNGGYGTRRSGVGTTMTVGSGIAGTSGADKAENGARRLIGSGHVNALPNGNTSDLGPFSRIDGERVSISLFVTDNVANLSFESPTVTPLSGHHIGGTFLKTGVTAAAFIYRAVNFSPDTAISFDWAIFGEGG